MLLNQDIRSHFSIEIISKKKEIGSLVKSVLAIAGYHSDWVQDESDFVNKDKVFHITVIDINAVTNITNFFEKKLLINPEGIFIIIGPLTLSPKFEDLRSHGYYGIVPATEGFDSALLTLVDLAASELYLRYQNEQLYEKNKNIEDSYKKKIDDLTNQVLMLTQNNQEMKDHIQSQKNELEKNKINLEQEIFQLRKNQSSLIWLTQISPFQVLNFTEKSDFILSFLEILKKDLEFVFGKIWYFKFLPEIQSFTLLYFLSWPEEKKFENIKSYTPNSNSPLELLMQMEEQKSSEELITYLNTHFGKHNYKFYPLFFNYGIEGFIAASIEGAGEELALRKINLFWNFFKWKFGYTKLWEKYQEISKNLDPVTQLEGFESYQRKLHEEFIRSSRTNLPLSLIKISLDSFSEIQTSYGQKIIDSILFQIAQIIKKTSRINDSCFRTAENEFTLILPHTYVQGAVVRAERLRRIIESNPFYNYSSQYVTISSGVSGFPELVNDLHDLEKSAIEALLYISNKSYNKVCLYKKTSNQGIFS